MLDSWTISSFCRDVLCLRTQRFILDSGIQHVSLRACKVQVFIRSTVEVRNKLGDAMARNRLGLRPPLLLVIE